MECICQSLSLIINFCHSEQGNISLPDPPWFDLLHRLAEKPLNLSLCVTRSALGRVGPYDWTEVCLSHRMFRGRGQLERQMLLCDQMQRSLGLGSLRVRAAFSTGYARSDCLLATCWDTWSSRTFGEVRTKWKICIYSHTPIHPICVGQSRNFLQQQYFLFIYASSHAQ